MRFQRAMCVLALLCLAAVSAEAATLEVLSGPVQVSTGGGFQKVTGVVTLKPGDKVLVEAGGSANLVYTTGCSVSFPVVGARATATVSETAPCTAQNPGNPFNTTNLLIGGAVIGGVVGIVLATQDDSSSP